MRRGDLAELAPWAWHCVECSARIVVKLRTGEQDGWVLLFESATQHLRQKHHDFRAERTFWESGWQQGGEPFDWVAVEDEREHPWDDDEANALAAEGHSLRELGRRYGIDAETVRRRLSPETMRAREGIKRGPAADPQVRTRIRRLLKRGMPMRQIAERVGVSRRQVERIKYAERPKPRNAVRTKSDGPLAAQVALMFD